MYRSRCSVVIVTAGPRYFLVRTSPAPCTGHPEHCSHLTKISSYLPQPDANPSSISDAQFLHIPPHLGARVTSRLIVVAGGCFVQSCLLQPCAMVQAAPLASRCSNDSLPYPPAFCTAARRGPIPICHFVHTTNSTATTSMLNVSEPPCGIDPFSLLRGFETLGPSSTAHTYTTYPRHNATVVHQR